MWYTKSRNIVVLGGAGNTPNRIHRTRRRIMNTVPHHALSDNPYTVYALIDPRDYAVCYVGITDDVYARFAQHLRCDGCNPAKDAWIAELKQENVMLIMKALETVETVERARERETFWIHHYRFFGTSLLNRSIPSLDVPGRVTKPTLNSKFSCDRCGSPNSRWSRKLETGRWICAKCYDDLELDPETNMVIDDEIARSWEETKQARKSNLGRQHKYDGVKDTILFYHTNKRWPNGLSDDMQRWYKLMYFTSPTEVEKANNPRKYNQHVKAYKRGRAWIAEEE